MDTFSFFLSIQIIFIFKKWVGGMSHCKALAGTHRSYHCHQQKGESAGGVVMYILPLSFLLNIGSQVSPRATCKGDWEM